jgi:dTDP-4-dehydrorhamnose reductase
MERIILTEKCRKKLLIIGGDARLSKAIYKLQPNAIVTTRRDNTENSNRLFLDLEDTSEFKIPSGITNCVIAGGPIAYKDGEENYRAAYRIHAIEIPQLVEKMICNNIHVTYISSNMVIGNGSKTRDESTQTSPEMNYGRLKEACERNSLKVAASHDKGNLFCIARLTKNISKETSPFNKWSEMYKQGMPIKVFNDLYFSPISFDASASFIVKIVEHNASGILHYSNERDMNYYEFARELSRYMESCGRTPLNVVETSSTNEGVQLIFNGRNTKLEMKRTVKVLGLQAMTMNEIYEYAFKKILCG